MNIPSADLKALLKRVSSVKGEMLILDTDGSVLVSDPDLTVRAYSPKITEGLGVALNSRKFVSVVNRMTGILDIQKTDNTVVIKSSKTRIEMEYTTPKVPKFQVPSTTHTLPLGVVRDLLKYTASAAHANKAASTGGVVQLNTISKGLFDDEAVETLQSFGTDDQRCAFSNIAMQGIDPFTYAIPLPAVAALNSFEGETFTLASSPSHFILQNSGITVYANKLSKSFPDFKKFIPKTFAFTASLELAELKRVLYTVEPMVNQDEANAVFVHFLDGTLNVKTVGKGGVAEDEMQYMADPLAEISDLKLKLSHKFLSDFLNAVTEEVNFSGNSKDTPVVLSSGNRELLLAPIHGGTKG